MSNYNNLLLARLELADDALYKCEQYIAVYTRPSMVGYEYDLAKWRARREKALVRRNRILSWCEDYWEDGSHLKGGIHGK